MRLGFIFVARGFGLASSGLCRFQFYGGAKSFLPSYIAVGVWGVCTKSVQYQAYRARD